MALRCAATRYASLLFSKTVHAAPRSGGSRYLLPEGQMSRLASPTYLSACATLPQQTFDYFLLLDFEATCSAEKGVPTPQEIIEFPVLKVNGRTFETEATFHTYVQPQAHPQLTAFCIELTGIVQDMVDGQPHLQQVLSQFDVWMREQGLLQARTVFVTFGDWDLQKMHSQIARVTGPRPSWMHCTSVGCLIWDATTAASTWWTSRPGLTLLSSGPPRALVNSSTMCFSVCPRSSSLVRSFPGNLLSTLRPRRNAKSRGPRRKPMWPRRGVPRLTDGILSLLAII
ncbi:ERI1 exoribonuclease 3 isoform X4 [Dermacentor andersoni]|uniref:ERI1 exoribonuclease 3 isoform X4 n=1 Tax=Dermacentor andersoni TaxID=34620 RepID=UPI0024179161|nr:ERI1 exoribonuclease 3-like isoform X4 [Dermacentor andersoni]